MAISTGVNNTSDMLRRLLERQKSTATEIKSPTADTGGGTATGDPRPPAPTGTFPTVGGTMPISVAPRPIDPGFWNMPGGGTSVPTGGGTAQPGLPSTPTPTTTDFGPGNNLIGSQINLPDTSRAELVSQMFNAMTPEMDRQAGLRREDLSRRISGLGRAGMGGVNTSFGDLEALESQRRSELLGKLTAEAGSADINDMFRRAGFLSGERGYQHGLDREAIGDQQTQAAMLAQLGYGFDPTQSGNFTNALMNSANASQSAANAGANQWANLANLGTQMMFR